MKKETFETCLNTALESAKLHVEELEKQVALLHQAGAVTEKAVRSVVESAKQHHNEQISIWNTFAVSGEGLGERAKVISALDEYRYVLLPRESLNSIRPEPPGSGLVNSDPGSFLDSERSAAEEYKDVRSHLKQAMKLNPLAGEMQATVSRRMHAVPALGSVPLPKNTAVHLAGTGSQAAQEIVATRIEQASSARPESSRQHKAVRPSRNADATVPSWQAEVQKKQREAGGDEEQQPGCGPGRPSARARPSLPQSAMASELEAVLQRRRNSAMQ
mmetsp:Transcript_6315/g.15167  ORF Transcript_6315/g.15167 Transcript_6315/m.15167 type:complete len:274 (-) Transcript_6315:303-1124(-)